MLHTHVRQLNKWPVRYATHWSQAVVEPHLCLHDHLRCIFKVKTQTVREPTQTDGSEEVDREPRIARIFGREHSLEKLVHVGIIEALL